MKLMARGAEAEIYEDTNKIIKKRVKKSYRIPALDEKLRKFRTRREAKVIQKLPDQIPKPMLIKLDDKNTALEIENIKGDKVRDVLDKNVKLCKEIGRLLAVMHNSNIVHGDLTTSNMILSNGRIFFIDFGLSFFSDKIEDKAVDLHLLKRALESKHYKIYKKAFELVLEGYKEKSNDYENIIKRLEKVESRGRYKGKR
ncbi:Kae1-associated serine/threonine protein kinase [Candidatus Woesearchaeota archaeon]|nr:Kae1-associated serine/threonine protein kinase [Candidatus Woesearchaeota archaeon]